GDRITFGYREKHDVRAALSWARQRHPEHRIGIVGSSLGGAAALLATPLEIDALVLEGVYPTIEQAVHNRVGRRLGPLHHLVAPALLMQLPLRFDIATDALRPLDHLGNIDCPVLIVAGDRDEHTTLAETRQLYESALQPKQLVVFPGAAHVDLYQHDPELYQKEILGFLDRHLKARP
ncbi:MAG: alpha/beta hydrolase, partial [Verrucomicrobiota bacterium]